MDFERRDNTSLTAIVATLEMMDKKLDKVVDTLHNPDGLCDRLKASETRIDSIQVEVTEHKSNSWKVYSLIVAICGVVVGFIEMIFKHKGG